MFVYERDGAICITFKDTKPVEEPEYIIAVDEEAGALYMVSGTIAEMPITEETESEDEVAVKVAPPTIEELDSFTENDYVATDAPVVNVVSGVPTTDELREKFEEEPESVNDEAPLVETTEDVNVPSVEELDNISENDPVKETTSDAVIDEIVDGPEVE